MNYKILIIAINFKIIYEFKSYELKKFNINKLFKVFY